MNAHITTPLGRATQDLAVVMPHGKIIDHREDGNDLLIKVSNQRGREWWFRHNDSGIFLEGQEK